MLQQSLSHSIEIMGASGLCADLSDSRGRDKDRDTTTLCGNIRRLEVSLKKDP